MSMAASEEAPEPLKYQTWVLKVFIHCEGCKRTVKKVLQSLDGVYETIIDAQEHKVTVTGNVDAHTLIKRLAKNGKPAELWPETKKPAGNNPNPNGNNGGGKNKNKNKNGAANHSPEFSEENQTTSSATKSPEAADGKNSKKGNKETAKSDGKDSGESPKVEKPNNGEAGGKKGKKAQPENDGDGDGEEVVKPTNVTGSGGGGHPRQAAAAYNMPMYPTPAPPAYVVSYNTMHPSMSYGAAYHPMPVQHSGGYYYSHPQAPLPGYAYNHPPPAAPARGSSYVYDDENANPSCNVM